jgi:hypothetical protein
MIVEMAVRRFDAKTTLSMILDDNDFDNTSDDEYMPDVDEEEDNEC